MTKRKLLVHSIHIKEVKPTQVLQMKLEKDY